MRLLDRGFFRIGGEDYAARNDSYGLATIQRRHVRARGVQIAFDYPAKGGRRRRQVVQDPGVSPAITALKRRRGGGPKLLAYRSGRRWVEVRSDDINDYLKAVTRGDFSAKDFRTWNATVLAAVALAVSGAARRSKTARRRAIVRATEEVAHYLGNTPAVARASYIDPRVFDRFRGWQRTCCNARCRWWRRGCGRRRSGSRRCAACGCDRDLSPKAAGRWAIAHTTRDAGDLS